MSIPKTMRAAVLYGEGDMRLVDDYPVPEPGPDEVLIRVAACAICGTDPKILAHGWPNHPPYGKFIFGHEYTGTVAALGPGVTELAVGDRVAVEPHKGCGVCANCRDGLYTTCLNYGQADKGHRHYGFSTNGGYAEYACNHVNSVYKVPADMPLDQATLITTAATSLYGIRRIGGIRTGETVVVSGPGPIGLMAVTMARLLGAGTIILIGTRPERLALGRDLGADVLLNTREENVVERVFEPDRRRRRRCRARVRRHVAGRGRRRGDGQEERPGGSDRHLQRAGPAERQQDRAVEHHRRRIQGRGRALPGPGAGAAGPQRRSTCRR